MIKKIFAMVSDNEFYRFRRQAYSKHLTLDKALTALAIAYGKGEISLDDKHRPTKEKKVVENTYLKDKEGGK